MLGEAKKFLQAVKTRQEEEQRLCSSEYDDSGYVCRWSDGKSLDPSLVSHKFTKLLRDKGLPQIRYHDLRHTAASIILSLGCSVKELSVFLGHNKASTTLDIYAHIFNTSSIGLMQKYDGALSGTTA